jgi:hypothetical protein
MLMNTPKKLLHGCAQADVPAILRDGLFPRVARDTPPGSPLVPPPAVWLTSSYRYAHLNATQGGRRDGAVLQVRVKGLDLDDLGGGVWWSLKPIKAKRITVVDTMTG